MTFEIKVYNKKTQKQKFVQISKWRHIRYMLPRKETLQYDIKQLFTKILSPKTWKNINIESIDFYSEY